MFYMTVLYKGFDSEKDARIIRKIGYRKNIGAGYLFHKGLRDLGFAFRFPQARSEAKRKLRGFKGLTIQFS